MTHEDLTLELKKNRDVVEAYVLVRDLKLYLEVGHDTYFPNIGVKIYFTRAPLALPYHFEVSHHVLTPVQGEKYTPGITFAETEIGAIDLAVSSTIMYLKEAIAAGKEPNDEWLVANKDF
jgi:hypothetical protein